MQVKSNDPRDRGAQPAKAAPRSLRSRDLLGDAREVVIEHDGELYRLRCTSKGKLILTK